MAVTKLILIRHGETLWNIEHRIQGQFDSPLTELGLTQAKALAKRLQNRPFAALYSSDLGRAYQTAHPISQATQLPIWVDQRLRERHFGHFQGLTRLEAEQQFPKEYHYFKTLNPDHPLPNGESLKQFRQRCMNCFNDLVHKHRGKQILIITHGGVLINLLKHTLHLPYETPRIFEVLNASCNIFSHKEDNWILETWGDISHWQSI